MNNQEIINFFKLTGSLMELHEENPFKIRSYQNAAFNLDKLSTDIASLSLPELEAIEGLGKSISAKVREIVEKGSLSELTALLEKTPAGVVELLDIKGIGPKKIRTLWKELGIESKEALLEACKEKKVSVLKGFGEKTEQAILKALEFSDAHKDKFLYAEIEASALALEEKLKKAGIAKHVSLAGELRRKAEVVELIQLLLGTDNFTQAMDYLDSWEALEKDLKTSGPFTWRGTEKASGAKVEIKIYPEAEYFAQLYIHSASLSHLLLEAKEGETLLTYLRKTKPTSEEAIFEALEMDYILPELREGYNEVTLAKEKKLPVLITYADLKGILHNHSTYSDGSHTLEQMARYCKELGFEYLGMADHSKSAFYANGLYENRVKEQWEEIDRLNKELYPFKILKGIESDILNDGSLDYEDDLLAKFDYIVASVHSNLKMNEEKATARLIKAIENPYTTILGHATGRLLLRREGYPIDHIKVIDACAANNVIIELNANPWRLDMEWKWLRYALEKNVMISINPDAHEMQGYHDMHYGIYVARKAGLTKSMCFNALSLAEIENFLSKKRKSVASATNA